MRIGEEMKKYNVTVMWLDGSQINLRGVTVEAGTNDWLFIDEATRTDTTVLDHAVRMVVATEVVEGEIE